MIKALSYSFKIFLSKPAISLFIAFEMFLLAAGANFALGQHNSHTMLYEPVEDYIGRQGFLMSVPSAEILKFRNDTDIKILTEEELNNILGDADIMKIKHFYAEDIDITVIPDDMFDKLRLPLDKGSIFDRNNPSDNIRIIVSTNENGYKVGSKKVISQQYTDLDGNNIVIGDNITFEVTAVLADPSYISHFSYADKMSCEQMFRPIDSGYYKGQIFCYTCESEIAKANVAKELISQEPLAIVSFKNRLSDEEIENIKTRLSEFGVTTLDNSIIEENSQKLLSDSFKRLLPAVFAFGVVVLIGIVSCSVIGAKSMLKKLAVFYCCGATKRKCILISVGQTIIISIIAATASAGALTVFVLSKLSDKLGFVFKSSNVKMTVGIFLVCILISAIAPTVLISKTDPRELLTDTANE